MSKTVVKGTHTEKYSINNGSWQKDSVHEDLGSFQEKTIQYEYDDKKVIETTTVGDNKSVKTYENNELLSETKMDSNNNTKTETVYGEDSTTETIYQENSTTTNVYVKGSSNKLSQRKVLNDNTTYEVTYDGNGNTNIIVQNGESINALAKKFGCQAEDIINTNKDSVKYLNGYGYFLVGAEIKIPREVQADDAALSGRKTATEAAADYVSEQTKAKAKAAAEAEADAAAKAEAAETAKAEAEAAAEEKHRSEMQKQGKAIAKDIYEDIDSIGTNKTFSNNIKRINKDNVVEVIQGYTEKSPNESIIEAILDEAGMNINQRKEAVTGIYNKLIERAKEKGIDTTQAEKEFAKAINLKNGYANNKDFDPIFNTLCAAINGKSLLTKEEKMEVANTTPQKRQANTIELLQDTVDEAEKSLNKQLAEDGWAADLWEGMKWCVGSDNLDEKVKADITDYKAQIATLKSAKTPEEFKEKFKEIYGVDYDPELVKAYAKRQEQSPLVEATHGIQVNFNKEMGDLLANDKLAPKTQYLQASSFGTGTYHEVASREQVYNERLNKFAEFIGQGDSELGMNDIEKAFQDAGLEENASLDDKYKVLHKIAQNYSEILQKNTMAATEGKGYDAFMQETESAYNAAFGLKNDIAKRVADYNISQKTGDMIVKGVVKGGAAIGLALVPGVGLAAAAIGTGLISATVDVTDRVSSDVGLKEGELIEILKRASIDGATVFAGGQLTKMLSTTKTFIKIGGQLTGDVAVGMAAEKLQTGTITLNGVIFQCVFSAAGNLVALKNMGKTPKNAPEADVPKPSRIEKQIKDAEVVRNTDTKHLDNKSRKLVEEDLDGIPTEAEVQAYQKEYGYQKPTPKEQADINKNNAEAEKATKEAHQVENNITAEEKAKLENLRKNMTEPDDNLNGVFTQDNTTFTIKNGKIVKIKTSDGREITDELKIAKYEVKHQTDANKIASAAKEKAEAAAKAEADAAAKEKADAAAKAKAKGSELQNVTDYANKRLSKMEDGEGIYLGRSDSPALGNKLNSRKQIYIKKQNGEYIFGNVGSNSILINNLEVKPGQAIKIGKDKCIVKMPGGEEIEFNIPLKNTSKPETPAKAHEPHKDNAQSVENNNLSLIEYLDKGKLYPVSDKPKIVLAGDVTIDFNDSQVKNIIDNMKDGQKITIGRAGDIRIKNENQRVSRIHIAIYKIKGKIFIQDMSRNGSYIAA